MQGPLLFNPDLMESIDGKDEIVDELALLPKRWSDETEDKIDHSKVAELDSMVHFDNNILKIDNEEIELPSDIRQVVEINGTIIVRTEVPDDDIVNIFAFDQSGDQVWEIDVPRGYVGLWENKNRVFAREFDGDEYVVDPETGKTEYRGWGGK